MQATYVARVTLREEGDLSEVEEILGTKCFTEKGLYAVASSPRAMLVGPYQDEDGREVRSFELTDYLVAQGLLSEDPDQRGEVNGQSKDVLEALGDMSCRVELYRVTATDVPPNVQFPFFGVLSGYEDRGPGPFVMFTNKPDRRGGYSGKPGAGWDLGN